MWLTVAAILGFANAADASIITFSGMITQSTPDGTGPAVNNPALNLIRDGDVFTVTLSFAGAITSPSPTPHDLTGASLMFHNSTHPVNESSFGFISLTVSADGTFDDVSLFACLTTGSGCAASNQLTANFKILATGLNSQNVTATGLDPPHPLDLLEDDGTTDIQASITSYSQTSVPEPCSWVLMISALGVLRGIGLRRRLKSKKENYI